jgi:hypothetical protein
MAALHHTPVDYPYVLVDGKKVGKLLVYYVCRTSLSKRQYVPGGEWQRVLARRSGRLQKPCVLLPLLPKLRPFVQLSHRHGS